MNRGKMKKQKPKPVTITRGAFMVKSGVLAGSAMLAPKFIFGEDCNLTTEDILGPYFIENAPIRTVIAHPDEPGQRLFITGRILRNDCETPISGAMLEVWHANDAGCYSINLDCTTGNPGNDDFNLRGKMFSNENGLYAFETVLPGNYASRPIHIHFKVTTPDGEILVSQIYFDSDPLCETDPWCQDAEERILSLTENAEGLHGILDIAMNTTLSGIIPGDVNLDGNVNVQDIVTTVSIILGNVLPDDLQMYAADMNQDTSIDILDIVLMVSTIMGGRNNATPLKSAKLNIENGKVMIKPDGEIAGIQLMTEGNFSIKADNLPKGWKLYQDNDMVLIFNQGGGEELLGEVFQFDGDLKIISNIITGWDARHLSADVNYNPAAFHLSDPFPNPFNPVANIKLNLKESTFLKVAVYDIKGRELSILQDGKISAGSKSLTWNASIYPSGIYFIKAVSGSQTQVRKVQFLK